MTATERQRRRRAKVKKERKAASVRQRRRKSSDNYIPVPPGITYWQYVTVLTETGPRQVCAPVTKPAPALPYGDFSTPEIVDLMARLQAEMNKRAGR